MTYTYEVHLHTNESSRCGRSPAREYIPFYMDKGYDGIVVTDHFYGNPSYVPDRVMAMEPQLHQIRMQEQMQRNMERMVDMRDGKRDYDVHFGSNYHDIPEPFQKFVIEIHFQQHPYWSFYTADMGGPTFSNTSPDANAYLRDYNNKVGIMDQLARALMELAFPGVGMQQAGATDPVMSTQAVVTPTMSVDAVSEIQRFKALVDQGILTEEEFAAKKRQLLGI